MDDFLVLNVTTEKAINIYEIHDLADRRTASSGYDSEFEALSDSSRYPDSLIQ